MLRHPEDIFAHPYGDLETMLVTQVLVDGTHSSGKTRVIEDYLDDRELLTHPDMDFGSQHGKIYPYRCAAERVGKTVVPVVVVAEEATQYAQMHPDRKLLTTDYNKIDQQGIIWKSIQHITMGAAWAAHMARELQPERRNPISVVLSDRGPLAGFVYSFLRLPNENLGLLNMDELAASTSSVMGSNPVPQKLLADTKDLTSRSDRVILTSPKGVKFEDNGLREADLEFRLDVAYALHQTYGKLVDSGSIRILRGDRPYRQRQLTRNLRELIFKRLIVPDGPNDTLTAIAQ